MAGGRLPGVPNEEVASDSRSGSQANAELEAASEEQTLAEVAREYGVHRNQVGAWKWQLLDGAAGSFTPAADRLRDSNEDAKAYLAKIGELTMEPEFVPKH